MTHDIESEGAQVALDIVGDLPRWVKMLGLAKPIEAKIEGVARRIEASADMVVDKIDAKAKIQRIESDGEALAFMVRKVTSALGVNANHPQAMRMVERWFTTELGHQENIETIGERAAAIIGGQQQMHKPNDDFVFRFYDDAQKVSDEQMRELYARVLAGELTRPGSIAVSTLEVLKRLDARTARLFQVWRSMAIRGHGATMLLKIDLKSTEWERFGLRINDLMRLNEVGLVGDFGDIGGVSWAIESNFSQPDSVDNRHGITWEYVNEKWQIVRIDPRNTNIAGLSVNMATTAGSELARVVPPTENPTYTRSLQQFLESMGLRRLMAR